jgi:four helix bundle protein
MATIKKFEDLEIWQLARALNIKLIPYLTILEQSRNFELKRQLDDSSGSVMDNIAEGFEREGNREFIQFLAIAKGSLGEARSQLFRLLDRNLIESQEFNNLQEEGKLLAGKIGSLMSYLRNSELKGHKFKSTN